MIQYDWSINKTKITVRVDLSKISRKIEFQNGGREEVTFPPANSFNF